MQMELACRAYMRRAERPRAWELADADRRSARGADAGDDQARRSKRSSSHCAAKKGRGPMTTPAASTICASSAPARNRTFRQELADRSAAADADEQSRSRRRRTAGRARRLWRHRSRRARLAGVRPHRRDAAPPRGRPDAARPVGQAGRRVPHPCRRAARADRQFQSRAALGDLGPFQRARSQGPDDVRADDRGLVDLYRLAGHRAGHLRDLRRDGAPALSAATFAENGF